MFYELNVYVGNAECIISTYYTSNTQIYCTTPPCTTDSCLKSFDEWPVSDTVEILVQVGTVEGILFDQSFFTYDSNFTPYVNAITSFAHASSVATAIGSFNTNLLSSIDVRIGQYHAFLGVDQELNAQSLNFLYDYPPGSDVLNFLPPVDMPAGFYNTTITLLALDSQPPAVASGDASFFFSDSSRSLYTSSLSGIVYTTVVSPVITSVSPSQGGIAGGTILTIKGFGFSGVVNDFNVLAGGVPCDVISATPSQLTCVTRPIEVLGSTQSVFTSFMNSSSAPFVEPYLNRKLSEGSAGVYVKLWASDWNVGAPFLDTPWHEGTTFSLWNQIGSNWDQAYPSVINKRFCGEMGFSIYAPLEGFYSLFVYVDDFASLFYSLTDYGVNETQLASYVYSDAFFGYYDDPVQQTRSLFIIILIIFFRKATTLMV